MKKGATIIFLISCAFSFSQELSFSRNFQAIKKNVAVAILNSTDRFYVLRYNKEVHDLTIERRAKPSAEITGFTPLKMDSVNASWFNYENLDYLFFERHKKLYFLFEKVVNTKRTVYLKIIDTLSKSSGFIELAELEQEKGIRDISFLFKLTAKNNILLVGSQTFANGIIKKTAYLYDPEKRKMLMVRKLPVENEASGYSTGYEFNAEGDLFYVLDKFRLVSYKRKFVQQTQVNIPVFFHDTLTLVSWPVSEQGLRKAVVLTSVLLLNGIRLFPGKEALLVTAHVSLQPPDSAIARSCFFSKKFSTNLDLQEQAETNLLDPQLEQSLTFYDGEDDKSAASKEYNPVETIAAGAFHFQAAERREDKFRKELLVWQIEAATGHIKEQYLVPRKIFSMGFSRFNNEGGAMIAPFGNRLSIVVPESPSNFKKAVSEFRYHRFKKVTNIYGANMVMYTLGEGYTEKKLLYRNSDFDLVPLIYRANGQEDMVFYLSSGSFEKFAIWKRSPL